MANLREKGQELYNFLHSFVESAGQELSEAFTSSTNAAATGGGGSHSAGRGGAAKPAPAESTEEADLRATIDFMFTAHAAAYHHVLQPFYALMIRFFRDPEEKYRNFCMQCVPAIIWHYIEVSSISHKQLENIDVPESLRNKLYGIAELPGIDRAISMSSDLRGAKASLEALILEIYNFHVCDSDGNPVHNNLTIPSLAIPSVYHDSSSFTSLALSGGGSKMESEMHAINREFGVGPQDHIHLGNRWRILKTILQVFNVDMANNTKHAVEAYLKLAANVTTSGFPQGTFALTSNVPRVVSDESQTNISVANNNNNTVGATDLAGTSQIPFSATPVTANNPVIDSPLTTATDNINSNNDDQQQRQQTPLHQSNSGSSAHVAPHNMYTRSHTAVLPGGREAAVRESHQTTATRVSQQSLTGNMRQQRQRNNSIRVLKEKLQRTSSNKGNSNTVSIAMSNLGNAGGGHADMRRNSLMPMSNNNNKTTQQQPNTAMPNVTSSVVVVPGPSLHGVGRNKVRIHAPAEFYIELLYGLYCVGVNYLYNAASKHRKANVREHDKIISVTSAELIQAIRIRSTLEMLPNAQMTASSVYRLWAWQYAKLIRQCPEIRLSAATRDMSMGGVVIGSGLGSLPAFGMLFGGGIGPTLQDAATATTLQNGGSVDVRTSTVTRAGGKEDKEGAKQQKSGKSDRHQGGRDTSPFSRTRSQMKNAAKELFSLNKSGKQPKADKTARSNKAGKKSDRSPDSKRKTPTESIPLEPQQYSVDAGVNYYRGGDDGQDTNNSSPVAVQSPPAVAPIKLVSFASVPATALLATTTTTAGRTTGIPLLSRASSADNVDTTMPSTAGVLNKPQLRIIPEQQPRRSGSVGGSQLVSRTETTDSSPTDDDGSAHSKVNHDDVLFNTTLHAADANNIGGGGGGAAAHVASRATGAATPTSTSTDTPPEDDATYHALTATDDEEPPAMNGGSRAVLKSDKMLLRGDLSSPPDDASTIAAVGYQRGGGSANSNSDSNANTLNPAAVGLLPAI